MEIKSVYFMGEDIKPVGGKTPTGFFRGFMNCIIENHKHDILNGSQIAEWFSANPEDPRFRSAVQRGAFSDHNGWYYSTHSSTPEKIGIMNHLANILNQKVMIQTV